LGLVRIWKQSKLAGGAYFLERTEVGTAQDIERYKAAKGTHSLERAEIQIGQDRIKVS